MKLTFGIAFFCSVVCEAAYSGDVVKYWVDQTAILINGTTIGGLQSPPSAWAPALVQGAQYAAAKNSKSRSLAFQQLAVSCAAHNTLSWLFHGTRNFGATDKAFKTIEGQIGIDPSSEDATQAKLIGKSAARKFAKGRADDGFNDFVDYAFGAPNPGVYQVTPGGNPVPDTPQARFVTLFAGVGNVSQFEVPPPPFPTAEGKQYEDYLLYVKEQGAWNSTVRLPYDTDTAYFWRESSPTVWNRIAGAVINDSLSNDVLASAKFFAQLNYALANAGIAAWHIKYQYNNWRPVTAIHRSGIWLSTGLDVYDPYWAPLLTPTPSHQDYPSTHSTFGGAASAVIRYFNGGSEVVDVTVSSNVTLDNRGVVTRRYTNLTKAAIENGESRVFGGLHFPFASSAGIELGKAVALKTLERFDECWDEF